MTETVKKPLDAFDAPYGRQIRVDEVEYESGMRLLRLTIREGARYTILNIDAPTAARWARIMDEWAGSQAS
jgi:hypothetical protein